MTLHRTKTGTLTRLWQSKRHMKNLSSLVLVAALCAVPTLAQACSCIAPPAPKVALEQSAAVFIGKAVKTESAGFSNTYRFTVSKKWKGVEGNTVSLTSATSSAACGINFDADREYLVYAFKKEGETQLQTNLCTRTKRVADAATDLAELGEPAALTAVAPTDMPVTYYPVGKGNILQINAEITRDPLAQLVQALQADKASRQFRVNWSAPTAQNFNGTALYNRAAKTLKVYSRAEAESEIRIESVLYSGVTDKVLTQLADTDEIEQFFKTYARYGVSRRDLGSKTVRVME